MKNFKPATASAAIAAGVILSAVSLAAGSAAPRAADAAAEAEYRNAVAACNRLNGGEARRCMRDAAAARRAAMIQEAQDQQGGGGLLEPDGAGGATPTYRKLPAGEFLPENLARNAVR